jgi:hypothetical protein
MKEIAKDGMVLTGLIVAFGIVMFWIGRQSASSHKPQHLKDDYYTIIWNDDIESMPKDGSTITIQQTIEDTIYVGPYER